MVITVHLVKPNDQLLPGYEISLRRLQNSGELPASVSGHVSYAVVPWKSRKGYARQALADLLQRAPPFGLKRVLITTHQDNLPSRRVIEATGGVLGGLVPYPSQPGKFRLEFLAIHARAASRAAAK